MYRQAIAVIFGLACGLAMSNLLYAKAAQGPPPTSERQVDRQRRQLQHKIKVLERELADQKDKLADLSEFSFQDKRFPPRSTLAIVENITTGSAGINRGSKDGLRRSDKIVYVRRTPEGPIIDGIGLISDLYSKDALTIKTTLFNDVRLDDEVYIINRENSQFSLINALLWYDK